MANIRLDMTVSLDGCVAGPADGVDEPIGGGGFRLFNWLDRRVDDPVQRVIHLRYRIRRP